MSGSTGGVLNVVSLKNLLMAAAAQKAMVAVFAMNVSNNMLWRNFKCHACVVCRMLAFPPAVHSCM